MKYFLFRNAYLERIISIFICRETAEEMANVFKTFYPEERMSIVLGNILNWNICNFSIPRVYWVNSLNWISHLTQELMFRWRRGKLHLHKFSRGKHGAKKCDVRTGIDVAFKRFICPISGSLRGFWPQTLPRTAVLLSPERDILSHLNYFPVPRVGNLTKKFNCRTYAPISLPPPYVQKLKSAYGTFSLRGRRSKWKGKGIWCETFPPSSCAIRAFHAPEIPFPFPFESWPRSLIGRLDNISKACHSSWCSRGYAMCRV